MIRTGGPIDCCPIPSIACCLDTNSGPLLRQTAGAAGCPLHGNGRETGCSPELPHPSGLPALVPGEPGLLGGVVSRLAERESTLAASPAALPHKPPLPPPSSPLTGPPPLPCPPLPCPPSPADEDRPRRRRRQPPSPPSCLPALPHPTSCQPAILPRVTHTPQSHCSKRGGSKAGPPRRRATAAALSDRTDPPTRPPPDLESCWAAPGRWGGVWGGAKECKTLRHWGFPCDPSTQY